MCKKLIFISGSDIDEEEDDDEDISLSAVYKDQLGKYDIVFYNISWCVLLFLSWISILSKLSIKSPFRHACYYNTLGVVCLSQFDLKFVYLKNAQIVKNIAPWLL